MNYTQIRDDLLRDKVLEHMKREPHLTQKQLAKKVKISRLKLQQLFSTKKVKDGNSKLKTTAELLGLSLVGKEAVKYLMDNQSEIKDFLHENRDYSVIIGSLYMVYKQFVQPRLETESGRQELETLGALFDNKVIAVATGALSLIPVVRILADALTAGLAMLGTYFGKAPEEIKRATDEFFDRDIDDINDNGAFCGALKESFPSMGVWMQKHYNTIPIHQRIFTWYTPTRAKKKYYAEREIFSQRCREATEQQRLRPNEEDRTIQDKERESAEEKLKREADKARKKRGII